MRKAIFLGLLPAVILVFAGAKKTPLPPEYATGHEVSMCGGQLSSIIKPGKDGKFIPLFSGLGHHQYKIHSQSDSAQVYFDQGLAFYYSYHFPEALASFKEAARFDAGCTMAYWGQALALGPYYNNYTYRMSSEVPVVLMSLQRTNTGAVAKENDLVNAMLQRYSSDMTNADRNELDRRYADAIRELMLKYPADNDIKTLYIDAVMLCHKWDFWHPDGSAEAWTPELVKVCESVLKNDPGNPAAMHYYIHLTEASRHPEIALPYADALKDLMPGVAHMVHMATHSYQRNGLFAQGVAVNEVANQIFNRTDTLVPALHLNKNASIHFFAVQSYCAMSAGMFDKDRPIYQRAKERMIAMKPVFKNEPYAQFVYMIPEIACVRLGKWQEILSQPPPNRDWSFAMVLDDFARGMAHVRTNNLAAAKECLANLKKNLADSLLAIRRMPYNKPNQPGQIACDILYGEILYAEGKKDEALTAFKNAVETEDKLIYREPQEWFIPARQYLGHYLLKMNKAVAAERVYNEDLVANPGNGWSLVGMYNSFKAQNKQVDAAKYKLRYQKAFEAGDIKPVGSIF